MMRLVCKVGYVRVSEYMMLQRESDRWTLCFKDKRNRAVPSLVILSIAIFVIGFTMR